MASSQKACWSKSTPLLSRLPDAAFQSRQARKYTPSCCHTHLFPTGAQTHTLFDTYTTLAVACTCEQLQFSHPLSLLRTRSPSGVIRQKAPLHTPQTHTLQTHTTQTQRCEYTPGCFILWLQKSCTALTTSCRVHVCVCVCVKTA